MNYIEQAQIEEREKFLADTYGVVEANRFEQMMLWQLNDGKPYTPGGLRSREWKEGRGGYFYTVGFMNGGDDPICISVLDAMIDGKKILFMHPTSDCVCHSLIERWLKDHLPPSAFKDDGRLRMVDADNFHNLF